MKKFAVNMTTRFVELASKPIRNKNHIITLMFEAITLLTYGDILENPTNNYVVLRVDKMKRLFFVIEDKVYSFNFPFNIEIKEGERNPIIYDPVSDLELDALNLTILRSAHEEMFYQDDGKGDILDLDSELIQVIDCFDTNHNKDIIWKIFKMLLTFEAGYLRYDYDEKREKGKLHPLNHLDINYSSEGTFKIGINNKVDYNTFIDILDIRTDCYFITK